MRFLNRAIGRSLTLLSVSLAAAVSQAEIPLAFERFTIAANTPEKATSLAVCALNGYIGRFETIFFLTWEPSEPQKVYCQLDPRLVGNSPFPKEGGRFKFQGVVGGRPDRFGYLVGDLASYSLVQCEGETIDDLTCTFHMRQVAKEMSFEGTFRTHDRTSRLAKVRCTSEDSGREWDCAVVDGKADDLADSHGNQFIFFKGQNETLSDPVSLNTFNFRTDANHVYQCVNGPALRRTGVRSTREKWDCKLRVQPFDDLDWSIFPTRL